jgi:serine/threonine-protein kinase
MCFSAIRRPASRALCLRSPLGARCEAKALAALDRPGIVTICSVEEAGGVHFLTMQLVEGQSLDRPIPPGGLPVERIVEIATAMAEALAVAHEKGIVHPNG